jgi:hypothetical protein
MWMEAPVDLVERLAVIAKRNRRSVTGEAIVAIERHVKAEEEAARAEEPQVVKGKKGGNK